MANSVTRHRVANASLLEYANKNRDEGFFSDITITAGNESIAANRLVLSCYSRFFEGMFKSQMRERYENIIEIQTIDGQILKILIDFIYDGSITINNQNVMRLLSGADYLQLHEIKQFCFHFLQQNVTCDNVLDILGAATLYKNDPLKDHVQQYINANLETVVQTADFKELSKDSLVFHISNMDPHEVRATSIYQAIITWILHDKNARKTDFTELFKLIKVNDIPMNFMEEIILEEDLVANDLTCQKLALSALRKQVMKQKAGLQASKILCLGGNTTASRGKVNVVYDLSKDSIVDYPDLPEQLGSQSSLKLNDFIYCIGGQKQQDEDRKAISNVWKLNSMRQNSVWEPVASMNCMRHVMGAAVYSDTLIVVGGCDANETHLDLSEFYQVSLNKWKLIASLHQRRSGLALVSLYGYLYALGGYNNEDKYLASVERLSDLTATSWETIESMQTPRRWLAAVNCKGQIYAIGGSSAKGSETSLKTVEKYDSVKNQWQYACDMNIERHAHAAWVLQGNIYVVGGLNKNSEKVKEIECYDPANNTWKVVGTVNYDVYHHSLVAV